MSRTVIIIPSRMAAKRLPGKPLLKLNNKTIITNVFKRAEKADLGTVYVATEDEEIYEEVKKNGGNCVMTEKGHRSGSDRIFDAILNLKLDNVKYVINLQGDEPLINPEDIKKLNSFVSLNNLDLGTLAANINSDDKLNNNNIVKVKTLKDLKKNSVIHERYEIIDFLLNLATKDETFSKKENNFIDKVSKELELNKEKYQEIKKQKTASVKFVDFGDKTGESVFGITKEMNKEEKLKTLRKEYSRWNALTNNSDKTIRERAREMRDLAANLRSKYNK